MNLMTVMEGIERVRACGYSEYICQEMLKHFARLPLSYTFNFDFRRHEDVLLHMSLLRDAWTVEVSALANGTCYNPLPQVHVRKVQSLTGLSQFDAEDNRGEHVDRKPVQVPKLPKLAFGSNTNLAGLSMGRTKVHPAVDSSSHALRIPSSAQTPAILNSILPYPFRSNGNPPVMDHDGDKQGSYGYEITLATVDRRGLLKFFTNALSNFPLQLNIKEAHIFSTYDGMALEVFVVEWWRESEPEDLKKAVLQVLSSHLDVAAKGNTEAELRASVEAMAYEDWTIDFKNLEIGELLGGGSSGRLHRGKYLGHDVAIKIIDLDHANDVSEVGSLRTKFAADLIGLFKQEVSIMRLVRQKNLVQFIGACSNWPKLCIVTELMAGGSVWDVVQSRGCGLDLPVALKVLRDAARGMDFLHRRGIVHRDLKAANLLIDEHSVVKVCDFGVARLKPAASSNFRCGNWTAEMTAETGTYRWMSPEVLEHKPYNHKVDVYSFGIMIWEVLTGEVPYAGLTPLQAAIGVVQRNLRPIMPPSVPDEIKYLAECCWLQDPNMRPEFGEVVVVLEKLIKPVRMRKSLFELKSSVSFRHF